MASNQTAKSALAFKNLLTKLGAEPPKSRPRPEPKKPKTVQAVQKSVPTLIKPLIKAQTKPIQAAPKALIRAAPKALIRPQQAGPKVLVQRQPVKTLAPGGRPIPRAMLQGAVQRGAPVVALFAGNVKPAVVKRKFESTQVADPALKPKKPKWSHGEVAQAGIAWNQHATRVKGRSDEERAEAKLTYAEYREQRLETGADPEEANLLSTDWWYCQVCLCCLVECDYKCYNNTHVTSANHAKRYKEHGGLRLLDGVSRPDPNLEKELAAPDLTAFVEAGSFAGSRVLALGEQDYSFSLAIAKVQSNYNQDVQLVATSYLAAHDPDEPEIHVKDDGMKAHYSRKSLPSMEGMLQKNISDIENFGGEVLHSVDATDLRGTFMTQCDSNDFDVIVFPFPRASLTRGIDTRNPKLLRNFFRSVNDSGILQPGGIIALVLLRPQYPDWDTLCLAQESGFRLRTHAALPEGFYQSREMSGKPWTPKDAEIYIFEPDA